MIVKLLTEHHLEFLSLKGSPESTLVKMSNCWKSHAVTQFFLSKKDEVLGQGHIILGNIVKAVRFYLKLLASDCRCLLIRD